MNALLTDLYQLTMAAGYFQSGMARGRGTFELTVRKLPPNRSFLIAAGLAQAVEYLLGLRFQEEELAYLRGLPQFARAPADFFDMLRGLRFTGDLDAVPEGSVLFAGEPFLTLRAPLPEAQIAETYLLSTISFQTLVATKAARVVQAAAGRAVAEYGTRRAHSPQAGVLAGRAAYIGGCIGTSNTLAGLRFGIPVFGTSSHAWVMAHQSELEAFRNLQTLLGPQTTYILDSYDTLAGARKAASLGPPLWGIRLDSGDFVQLARRVRRILDAAGLTQAKIIASGDLDESSIRNLVAACAPIDAFGVGTELVTSADSPRLGAVYKLVEIECGGRRRPTAKFSPDKLSLPSAKQVFRFATHDRVGLAAERPPEGAHALLEPVMRSGELIRPLPDAAAARQRAQDSLARLPEVYRRLDDPQAYRVEYSAELLALAEKVKDELKETEGDDGLL